jgi:DNA-dependent metalloprotease WSS1
MKDHHLSVTTLEEYEPNREFVGRNFNAGEIIQLVLKSQSGHWLPFNYVQMVMMHELAHCKQMNHSRAFWKVRNEYAEQMRVLWSRGYTGEGLWGRGALLGTGEFEENTVSAGEDLPEHLCGGTYRSRRRKRRAKPDLSYQQKKQRRIDKKFGKNGIALGADEDVKLRLEKGRATQAAPRVAQSKRGRELRAAAALARFDQQKQDSAGQGRPDNDDESSASESDSGDAEGGAADAVDINGQKLLDRKGNGLIRVCGDESPDDQDAANELRELQASMARFVTSSKVQPNRGNRGPGLSAEDPAMKGELISQPYQAAEKVEPEGRDKQAPRMTEAEAQPRGTKIDPVVNQGTANPVAAGETCTACSLQNEAYAVTCSMCSNVLDPASVPGTWSCQSVQCKDSTYLNAGDCGTCGICGQRKGAPG